MQQADKRMVLEDVVPWGRNLREYIRLFSLSEADLGARIVGCGDGPASFNSELTSRGGRVVSADPIYRFSAAEIKQQIDKTYPNLLDEVRKNRDSFIWDNDYASIEELGRIRMTTMRDFLKDYEKGKSEGRYMKASLPNLPFEKQSFDIALCSHFLFLYTDHLSFEFHIDAALEMLRIAGEVRIFPLVDLSSTASPYLEPFILELEKQGYRPKVEKVVYHFQKDGDRMLRIMHT